MEIQEQNDCCHDLNLLIQHIKLMLSPNLKTINAILPEFKEIIDLNTDDRRILMLEVVN